MRILFYICAIFFYVFIGKSLYGLFPILTTPLPSSIIAGFGEEGMKLLWRKILEKEYWKGEGFFLSIGIRTMMEVIVRSWGVWEEMALFLPFFFAYLFLIHTSFSVVMLKGKRFYIMAAAMHFVFDWLIKIGYWELSFIFLIFYIIIIILWDLQEKLC